MVMLAWSVAVLFCLFPGSCRLFSVLNSGVLLFAMQPYWPCHLGVDNLNVARSIGCLLDHDSLVKPLPLVKDGDLIALARYMIRTWGRETVRVTKVKGHAEDVDVQQGRVRLEDQVGNAEDDGAADLGRRHQFEVLIDARRRLLKARSHWYPIMTDLHRFMIAIARVSVNHDGRGGTAPDPWFGIRGVGLKFVSLLLGLMLILRLFLVPLVSYIVHGFRLMLVTLLILTLLLGRTVLVFCLDLLLFSIPCIGQLVLMTWVILVFLFWNFLSFLSNGWPPVA